MDVIGWADASVWRVVRRMLRSLLIGWADASILYDEASALSSCQTNLIGRAARLVSSWWMQLIGPSDRIVLQGRFLLANPPISSFASSLGFLATRCQTCKRADEKMITRNRLLWVTNMLFWSVFDAKTDKMNITLCYLLYPVVKYIYCALCSSVELGKCYFCICVVLMSTCSEYYD